MGPPEVKPAYYALAPGGWRDYVTVLHLPYTAWNLSYVALGAAIAPHLLHEPDALDDGRVRARARRRGARARRAERPAARDARSATERSSRSRSSRSPARARSASGPRSSWGYGLLVFVAVGAFLVPAYNLEWFGGRFHTDWGLALAWAAFPVLTAYYAQAETLRAEALLAAAYATAMILVQRTLSTPVRHARRDARDRRGRRADGACAPHPPVGERPSRRCARDGAPNLEP